MSSVMKIEDNKRKAEQMDDFGKASKKIDMRDRQGQDIIGFSNYSEGASGAMGKKKVNGHQACQDNGNLTHWEK